MERVRELPHTADIGFEVEAPSLARLFALAAEGLVSALGVEAGAGPGAEEEVALSRPDLERLLVAWLRELLHRATTEDRVPVVRGVEVRTGEGDGGRLRARVEWREWAEGTGPEREIKGVTYHDLAVEEDEDGWHARVVLDV